MDLALNNLQRLICHKTETNKQTYKTHIHTYVHIYSESQDIFTYVFICSWVYVYKQIDR